MALRLYVMNHWLSFPTSEYGGQHVVMAQTDDECVYLCSRANTGYFNLPHEQTTPEIRAELREGLDRQSGRGTHDALISAVATAWKIDLLERRLDSSDGNFYSKQAFFDHYGSTQKWEVSAVERGRIISSFTT